MVKSISQIYADEVKSLPLAKNGRVDPLETSRLKAELHVRFWQPIAAMLDPRDRYVQAGSTAQDFYSRRGRLAPHEIEESLALMKRYLGLPRLTFGTWFQTHAIFREILADALTHADMDLVVCAVREFIRIELGQDVDPKYGHVDSDDGADQLRLDRRDMDDEDWFAYLESQSDFALQTSDFRVFYRNKALHDCFGNPAEFDKQFPDKMEHRLNMARALEPIFERDWFSYWPVIERAFHFAKALLAINFKEALLTSQSVDCSDPVEIAEVATLSPA